MAIEERTLELPDRRSWREWLEENHDSDEVVWLVIYKRSSGKDWMTYPEALEEAISFGWIDSRMRRIDDEKHVIRFTKRKPNGNWSVKNLNTARKIITEGGMTEYGRKFMPADLDREIARANDREGKGLIIPDALRDALLKEGLLERFEGMSPSHRRAYNHWISQAKRPETLARRLEMAIDRIRRGEMPMDMTRWKIDDQDHPDR